MPVFFLQASNKFVDKAIAQAVRNQAAQFITWLKEAETESDSDDDDDDDGGVVYAHKPPAQDAGDKHPSKDTEYPEGDSDLDIDNIWGSLRRYLGDACSLLICMCVFLSV